MKTAKAKRAKAQPAQRGSETSPTFATIPLSEIKPAPQNDVVYGAIHPDDPALDDLVASIRQNRLREPIVLTLDNVILSGHRRYAACRRLGFETIKARFESIRSTDPQFLELLVTYNAANRNKTPDVLIREQMVLVDPVDTYQTLQDQRAAAARVKISPLALGSRRQRAKISRGAADFLNAVRASVERLEDYWPLSDRRIHYDLLNEPPVIHLSRPIIRYRNDQKSYKKVCRLLTQARLEGLIPFEAIGDETRPVATYDAHPNVAPFVRREVEHLFRNYWRDLLQGQPNHVEIVGEKMTVEGTIKPIAYKYTIPYTVGRGYSSLPPRKGMYDRYVRSGKKSLIILFLSDHDPEGWDIAESFSKSMRDDFGVQNVHPIKVGLTPEQVGALGLMPNTDAKKGSSRYKKFVERFGKAVYELEAAPPERLRNWLTEAINSVIDVSAFNVQVEAERQESAKLDGYRRTAVQFFRTLNLEK